MYGDLLTEVLKEVQQIRVDTTYGPPIVMDYPFKASSGGGGAATPGGGGGGIDPMKLLKPRVTIVTSFNKKAPFTYSPKGAPGETKWPYVKAALLLGGAVVGLLAVKGALDVSRGV